MATNQQIANKLNRLFSFLPGIFNSKKNFSAVLGAIAEGDADLENLFLEVKRELFIDTADGQYLDMLGSNVGVTRPPLVGMVDTDYREFIKLETYYPKQIKQLLFRLMELFYGRDAIKASIRSTSSGPYNVFDGANLLVRVEGGDTIEITFRAASFNDSTNVSSAELAAQINAQAPSSMFAASYFNVSDKLDFLDLFTNTYGPVGSIEVMGGSANRFLKFPDTVRFGSTISSEYSLTKQDATMRLYWAGGDNPTFSLLRTDDSVILTGSPFDPLNVGSFYLIEVTDTGVPADTLSTTAAEFISANVVRYWMPSVTYVFVDNQVIIDGFVNASNNGTFKVLSVGSGYIEVQSTRTDALDDEVLVGTVDLTPSASYISFLNDNGVDQGAFPISTVDDVLFFRSTKKKLENAKRAATVWEINPNEIVITLPATPVVVRRYQAGSAHAQGTVATVSHAFLASVDVKNPEFFPPMGGRFYLQKSNGTLLIDVPYTYATMNGDTLLSVSPTLQPVGDKLLLGVGPLSMDVGSSAITVTTTEPHGLISGEIISLKNFDGFAGVLEAQINGVRQVTSVISELSFTVNASATASSTTTNAPSVDKGEIFTVRNSRVFMTNVQGNTGYVGSFIYDPKNAKYTISELQTTLAQDVLLGAFGGSTLVHNSAVFPDSSGQVIIAYGREDEEGPVSYIAKPGTGALFIDPSYRFKSSHSSGVAVNLLTSNFATIPSVAGKNFSVYVVDTISPRNILKALLLDAKAAGVSVRFIVTLPENVYNFYSLYS